MNKDLKTYGEWRKSSEKKLQNVQIGTVYEQQRQATLKFIGNRKRKMCHFDHEFVAVDIV